MEHPFIVFGVRPHLINDTAVAPTCKGTALIVIRLVGGLVELDNHEVSIQGLPGSSRGILGGLSTHRRFVESLIARLVEPDDRIMIVIDQPVARLSVARQQAIASGVVELIDSASSSLAITVGAHVAGLQWLEDALPGRPSSLYAFWGQPGPLEEILVRSRDSVQDPANIVAGQVIGPARKDLAKAVEQLGHFRIWAYIPDYDAYNLHLVLYGRQDSVECILKDVARCMSVVLYDGGTLDDAASKGFLSEVGADEFVPKHWCRLV